MANCRDIALLLSQSLDETLPVRKRLAVKIHLFICRECKTLRKHLLFLKDAAEKLGLDTIPPLPRSREAALSPEFRARLRASILDANKSRSDQ
jgi:hypothetical protein